MSMADTTPRMRITPAFNCGLFLFSAAIGLLSFLLSEKANGVPAVGLVLTTTTDLMRFLLVMFITAYFLREIWRRLVSDLFSVRPLNFQEAIAIVLLVGIVVA